MIRNNVPVRLIKLCCLSALIGLCSWSPEDFLSELQEKYDNYMHKYPVVNLNLLFDQPAFAPGDTAFFRAWYLDDNLQGIRGEHIVTLDLLNGGGKTSHRMRFKVKNGIGYGQIIFEKNFPPGIYEFVGYTDWMKNFGQEFFYRKRLSVVSRVQFEEGNDHESRIKFYPEGGNFVGAIANSMTVVGPPSTAFAIVNQAGEEVTSVSLDSSGLGSFVMTPELGQRYSAVGGDNGKRWPLPAQVKDGIGIRMEPEKCCVFQFSVPPDSRLTNKETYAIVVARGKILSSEKLILSAGRMVEWSASARGGYRAVHELYLLDGEGKVLIKRAFVPYPSNPVSVSLRIPSEVRQRENVPAMLELRDAYGNPVEADLSVTVFQEHLFKDAIGNDLLLSQYNEVAEWIENYGNPDDVSLNNFLATQALTRLNWEMILSGKDMKMRFPFYGDATISGQVVSKKTGAPCPDSTMIIGYLQTNTIGYEAYTHEGKFEMPLPYDVWGDDRIFCTLRHNNKSLDDSYTINIFNDTLEVSERWQSDETIEPSRYGIYAQNRNVVNQSYSFFSEEPKTLSASDQNPNSVFEDEFRGTDFEVNVTEYLTFASMAELLQEIVPYVHYRKRGSVESIRMSYRYETTLKVFKDDPLYIIDGVMSKNTAYFLSIKPEDVASIKILNNPNKLTQLGKLGENAVIFVESRKGNLSRPLLNENLFPFVGLSRPIDFHAMRYTQNSSRDRIPDMRSTLFWNPALVTDKQGNADINFFASDDIGPMNVVIQGVTKDGRSIMIENRINVVFNPGK